jgi:hypothetical protein
MPIEHNRTDPDIESMMKDESTALNPGLIRATKYMNRTQPSRV